MRLDAGSVIEEPHTNLFRVDMTGLGDVATEKCQLESWRKHNSNLRNRFSLSCCHDLALVGRPLTWVRSAG